MTEPRVAIYPLQWFAQPDGRLDFSKGPATRDLARQVRTAGFTAMHAFPPDTQDMAEYAEQLRAEQVRPAPGYLSVPLDQPTPHAQLRSIAARFAERQAVLGLTEAFVADEFNDQRVAQPGIGAGVDADRLARVVERLEVLAATAAEIGVRLCLHPHVGTWIETEQEVRYALAAAGSVGFGPDTGHLAWAGCDVVGLLRDNLSRIGAVHIKDANLAAIHEAARAQNNLFQHVLAGAWQEPGRGEVPLLEVVELLRPTFSGWWVIEVDRASLGNPQESATWCAAWAQQHLSAGATT